MEGILDTFRAIIDDLLVDEKIKPVARFQSAERLYDCLDLDLADAGIEDSELHKSLRDLVFSTPRTATTGFFNQLFGGRNEKAILGDLLAVMLNNSMYTYKAAGPQVGVEKVILRKVCDLLGWDTDADGTFASGGSMTNFMAMVMARDAADVAIKKAGMKNTLRAYTSVDSHYSISKNAAFCGIGRDNVVLIDTNEKGEMLTEDLSLKIKSDLARNYTPFFVNATAGTTVLGAFDPLEEIGRICNEQSIWLHVDGAYGGSVLVSESYRHLIKGIGGVDSFSFNAHKMLGTPLTCSLIVVRKKKHLHTSFSNDASYLYQTNHDDFNLGKTSLQCGRRNDALKFWTLWKSVGTKGLAQLVDKQFALANTARKYIKSNANYTLYSFDDSTAVCFNYLDIAARDLCTQLYEHEELLVGYGTFRENEFVRLVTVNPNLNSEEILDFFKKLEIFVAEHF